MAVTNYGDISPRTAAYASKEMLRRGAPYLVIERFGQSKPLPKNKTDSVKFRRYEALDASPNALSEGVTPTAKTLTKTDVLAELQQYGDLIGITDVIEDTHEDPVLQESVEVLGEQQAQMLETVRYNKIKAGTNVMRAGGAGDKGSVNKPLTLALQRAATRSLKRQNARKVTKVLRSTPSYETANVAPAYVAMCHPDLEADIRQMDGFTPVERYGQETPWESEIGKVEDVRYVSSTIFTPEESAGGDPGTGDDEVVSTDDSSADVYSIFLVGKDAYGIVPLKGRGAVTPSVVNPSSRDKSDPLGQRGYAGWKAYQTAAILNDAWMIRLEVAVSAL